MFKRIGRSRVAQGALAFCAARYLRLVARTTRYTVEPPDFHQLVRAQAPVIAALWHGQHVCAHVAWPEGIPVAALISRNADAEATARALEQLGVRPIRGSGGRAARMRDRGGFAALREMLRHLSAGYSLVMTADVPKKARVCGAGIVTLARLSGRPVFPLAVASARRIDFKSWDRASLPLPFGRGAIVVGDPILVPEEADEDMREQKRLEIENALDVVHARAYALVGGEDPGAVLSRARNGAPAAGGPP